MDFTGYTPIYVRTTGNDSNDGLTEATAVRLAYVAFAIALEMTGSVVLDFGAGNTFGNIDVGSSGWPSRIALRGAGASASHLALISSKGINAVIDEESHDILEQSTSGDDLVIHSDKSITIDTINAEGGACLATGDGTLTGNGSSAALTDLHGCVIGSITLVGGNGYNGCYSGDFTAHDCQFGNISLIGGGPLDGNGSGGMGGLCTLDHSVANNVNLMGGGASGYGSIGGRLLATDCTLGIIESGGTEGQYAGASSNSIEITRSSCSVIIAKGGFGSSNGGMPGSVHLTDSTADSIRADGGNSVNAPTTGGEIVMIRSSCAYDLSVNGGACDGSGPSANAGSISLYDNSHAHTPSALAGVVGLGGDLGQAGYVVLDNSSVVAIDIYGLADAFGYFAGSGGGCYISNNSTVENAINAWGGDGQVDGGSGGSVSISDSTVAVVEIGGGASTYAYGGPAGSINGNNSAIGTVTARGGFCSASSGYGTGGIGGSIHYLNVTFDYVSVTGGYAESDGDAGNGGEVVLTRSSGGSIEGYGGDGGSCGLSANISCLDSTITDADLFTYGNHSSPNGTLTLSGKSKITGLFKGAADFDLMTYQSPSDILGAGLL